MATGGLASINENQARMTENGDDTGAISQMDMGMDDDSIMKDESRLSARGKEQDDKLLTEAINANDSILSKQVDIVQNE